MITAANPHSQPQPDASLPGDTVLDPPVEVPVASIVLVDDVRQEFRDKFAPLIEKTLGAPSAQDAQINQLLKGLNQLTPCDEVESVRQGLEDARRNSHQERAKQLARDIVDIAIKLDVPIQVNDSNRSANANKRSRLSTAKRRELTHQLLAQLGSAGSHGMSKSEIATHLNISINQAKGILNSKTLRQRIQRIGHGKDTRYIPRPASVQRGN